VKNKGEISEKVESKTPQGCLWRVDKQQHQPVVVADELNTISG
jgi:hypothetical protein